jgi:hypothetical protein
MGAFSAGTLLVMVSSRTYPSMRDVLMDIVDSQNDLRGWPKYWTFDCQKLHHSPVDEDTVRSNLLSPKPRCRPPIDDANPLKTRLGWASLLSNSILGS